MLEGYARVKGASECCVVIDSVLHASPFCADIVGHPALRIEDDRECAVAKFTICSKCTSMEENTS